MRGRTALVAAVAATGLVVGGAVAFRTGGPGAPDQPSAPTGGADGPAAEPTTLASYDVAGVEVARAPFCERVSPTGIEHALGGPPASNETWDNGDRVRLPDGSRDRVQEYGCRWTAADGTTASAWVFVPPVDPRAARALAREEPAADCTRIEGDRFGGPSVTWACPTEGGTQERYAGRLGDAWLTCTLTAAGGRDTEADTRTSEWCVAVVEAARA
ncbi:hypothetical protein GCM10009623_08160 [Nocardioides aestuarii]|uniref:DUF3558 domain-containing protein n=1 Tax=Nocardioides aestuarii TaxID=252231 RepID=A0ABW4THY4_9ACTN